MFRESGIAQLGMSTLLIIMQVTKLIADLPTGIIADRYGRRNLLILANICRISFMALWAFLPSYSSFAIGMALWGISMSCLYGNTEAYIYDQLKIEKREGFFAKIVGRYYAIQNIAISAGSFLGGYFFLYGGHKIILLLSTIPMLLGIIACLKMPNYHFKDFDKRGNIQKVNILNALKESYQNKKILTLLAISAINDALFIFLIDLNTTLMVNLKFQEKNMAILVGTMGVARIFTNFFAGYTVQIFKPKTVVSLMLLAFTVMIITANIYNYAIVIMVIIYLIFYGFVDLAIKTRIQDVITSGTRATVMSIASFCVSILAIALNTTDGFVTNAYSNRVAIMVIFIALLATCSILYRNIRRITF
jgi:MFS family permease